MAITCNYSPIPSLSPLPKFWEGEKRLEDRSLQGKPPANSYLPGIMHTNHRRTGEHSRSVSNYDTIIAQMFYSTRGLGKTSAKTAKL